MLDKRETRNAVRRALAQIEPAQRQTRSERICARVEALECVREADTVALFASLPDEPQSAALLRRLAAAGRKVVVPRVEGCVMEFYAYRPEAMARGAFGIDEPQQGEPVRPADIDVMILPGVAFTAAGARLGRGKGFYDRYMSREGFRARRIGVCFAEQIVAQLPSEPHDMAVDEVIFG